MIVASTNNGATVVVIATPKDVKIAVVLNLAIEPTIQRAQLTIEIILPAYPVR